MSQELTTGAEETPFQFRPDGTLAMPQEATQEEWAAMHGRLITAKRFAKAWIKHSREWATAKWGMDFVATAEVQMEMALGIESPEKPADLNPQDKSSAIIMIEGISQSFAVWQRKMAPEIEEWDRPRLQKFLDLVGPMEAQAKRVRELLGGDQ